MITIRSVMAEVVRALAVLALVFLSFAGPHSVAAPGYQDDHGYAGYDFCGTPPDNPVDHAPCHACRASPVVLPAAPEAADPAFAVEAACANVAIVSLNVANPARTEANPRAPPAPV